MSVVVPFAGGRAAAEAMLEGLARLRLAAGDEIIVADNTGTGTVSALSADEKSLEVVAADHERSSYYARNAGAEAARNAWLLFVDADCRPAPTLLDDFFAQPLGVDVAIVSGGVRGGGGDNGLMTRHARARDQVSERWHLDEGPYPAGITGNLLVRRDAWEALGGFYEGVRSGEDVEFCWRAQAAGWGFAHRPEAWVEHHHPETLRDAIAQAKRHAAGRFWLNRRWSAVKRPRPLRALVRAGGGAVVWAARGRFERAAFKLIDGVRELTAFLGYFTSSNRAAVGREPATTKPATSRAVAFFADAFPARSETFVYNEVQRLRAQGWALRVESSTRPPRIERSVARTETISYVEDDSPPEKLRALLWLVSRHPLRALADARARRRWAREERVWPLAAIAPAARRIARGRERHVHAHFAATAAMNAMRVAHLLGITYSVAPHAYDIFQTPRNLPEKLRRAAFVVTDCDYNVDALRALVPPSQHPRIHRLVLGVDAETFRRGAPPPGRGVVAAVGRLVEKKGFSDLVDAAALLAERSTPLRVVICGAGPLRESLEARIRQLDLTGVVEITEAWGAAAIRDLLEKSDVFALPCVVAADGDRDSMPVAIKEALAMELPVVGTGEVGIPEMVTPAWGRLVPPHDSAALAGALEELLALAPEERRRMGARGRAFVLEHCSLERETARLAELLGAAIATDGASGA